MVIKTDNKIYYADIDTYDEQRLIGRLMSGR